MGTLGRMRRCSHIPTARRTHLAAGCRWGCAAAPGCDVLANGRPIGAPHPRMETNAGSGIRFGTCRRNASRRSSGSLHRAARIMLRAPFRRPATHRLAGERGPSAKRTICDPGPMTSACHGNAHPVRGVRPRARRNGKPGTRKTCSTRTTTREAGAGATGGAVCLRGNWWGTDQGPARRQIWSG